MMIIVSGQKNSAPKFYFIIFIKTLDFFEFIGYYILR